MRVWRGEGGFRVWGFAFEDFRARGEGGQRLGEPEERREGLGSWHQHLRCGGPHVRRRG
jgi:hypothetical protein